MNKHHYVLPLVLLAFCALPLACVHPMSPVSPAPTATPTPVSPDTPTPTPSTTPSAWDVVAGSPITLQSGINYTATYIHLHTGATLVLEPNASYQFSAEQYFTMDSGSTILALPSSNVTAGSPNLGTSSAGAGHGGAGGSDGLGNAGGAAYDSSTLPVLRGSPGAAGSCTGGPGGGGVFIYVIGASGAATLNGVIDVDGSASNNCSTTPPLSPSGAGSGGTIYIGANSIQGTGSLTAQGGTGLPDTGGANNAGGGGGGIISLGAHTANNFTGTYSVQGGAATAPAQPGQAGSFTFTTN